MVSNDTNSGRVKLLEENNYFGMDKDQVILILVQQGDSIDISGRYRIMNVLYFVYTCPLVQFLFPMHWIFAIVDSGVVILLSSLVL